MVGLLNNYSANIPGFFGQGGMASNVSNKPNTIPGIMPWEGEVPRFNSGGMGMPPPPPLMQMPQIEQPQSSLSQQQSWQPLAPGQVGQLPSNLPQNPNYEGITGAANQALMNQLGSGAVGMQQPSPLVSANAQKIGAAPRNLNSLFGV